MTEAKRLTHRRPTTEANRNKEELTGREII